MRSDRSRTLRRTLTMVTVAATTPALFALAPPASAAPTPSPAGSPTADASPSPSATPPVPTTSASAPPTPAASPTAVPPQPSAPPTAPTTAPSVTAPTQGAAAAATATSADDRIAAKLAARATPGRFGSSFAGTVLDVQSNRVVWSKRPNSPYLPASNAKLFTAANALDTFGPDARFRTFVKQGSRANHVVIVGNGDPLLTSAKLDYLARKTAEYVSERGIADPRVYVDDDYFPTPSLAYGWKQSYLIDDVTPVRALVRDNKDLMDTSRDAAIYFRWRLRVHGLPGAGYFGTENSRSSATTIAKVDSVTVGAMVDRMLLTSDNDVAEILLRKTSSAMGNGRTWAGARATQSEGASAQGLSVGVLYDGSGLSRADRVSTNQLAQVVRRALDSSNPKLATMRSSQAIPQSGRTGTLKNRFTSSSSKCAVGKVYAKTGTLKDVVALSGWTTGTDGRIKVFSFLVNARSSSTAVKNDIDLLAATVTGCI